MKIALVHDQLYEFGGAERVFFELKSIFPKADIYTAFVDTEKLRAVNPDSWDWKIHESWISYIPFITKLYSPLRFLAPFIWESFDFSAYDVVISSSGWYMSKGIITKPHTKHFSYVHHQPKYLYYYETARDWQKYWPVKIYGHFINHFLRTWDFVSSQRADILIANSHETRKRIQKFYRRDAVVIYPPINTDVPTQLDPKQTSYYVTVSRLEQTKHIDLLIKSANQKKYSLKIAGTGRHEEVLRGLAGKTVKFVGRIPDEAFDDFFAGAKAFLYATVDEEFGMVAVEALARGVPVIAFASGGVIETIESGKNGFLFEKLTAPDLSAALEKFESLSNKELIEMRKHAVASARQYSKEEFKKQILKLTRTV